MLYPIPEGSVEIQVGLWAYYYTFTAGSITRSYYKLYSSEGYCFYDLEQPENYDEEGNLKPAAERVYAQYATTVTPTIEEINQRYVSVPVDAGYEIVSVSNRPVTE